MAINKLVTSASLKELIDKIEEIDEAIKSLTPTDNFELNVVVSNELPSTVINGKIVIIDSGGGNLYFDNKDYSSITGLKNNDIYIRYGSSSQEAVTAIAKKTNININLYLIDFYKYTNNAFSDIKKSVYIGVNGTWEKIEEESNLYYIFKDGKYTNNNITLTESSGGSGSISIINDSNSQYYKNVNINSEISFFGGYLTYASANTIDLSQYSKLILKMTLNKKQGVTGGYIGISDSKDGTSFNLYEHLIVENEEKTITLDISQVKSKQYLKMYFFSDDFMEQSMFNIYISEIGLSV